MSRRTGLGWMGTLAVGLGSLGVFGITTSALAAPMTATLDGSGAMSQQTWQTAYLMAEGSAEAKVIGPLNRGARLEIDPAKSSDQYWFVKVPDSPNHWQGYVWKDFVKVGGAEPAPAATAKVAPMADSLAQREEPKKKPAEKIEKATKPAVDEDEPVVARPRVELEKAEKAAKKDSALVAYDPEMFEVSDPKDVKATPDTEASDGWDASVPAKAKDVVAHVPRPATPVVPSAAPPAPVVAASQAPVPPPARVEEPPKVTVAEIASPVRQIQALREQIERELEVMPPALTPNAAQNVDGLVARLNEVLRVEKSMLTFLESTTKMVEAHDKHIHELQQKVTTLSSRSGGDRTGLNDEVTRLRKRLDELSATVSTTRQHAKRIDALEAELRKSKPVSLEPMSGGRIGGDHGAIVLSAAPKRDLDKRAGELESRLKASRKRAATLAKSIQDGPPPSPAEVDIPAIDARDAEKDLARAEAELDDGVLEVTPASRTVPLEPEVDAPVAAPPPLKLDRVAAARAEGRSSLEKGAGLENGTVAAMLKKLRDLREQRRREREGVVEVTGTPKPEETAKVPEERAELPAPVGSGSPPELEPVPDDMREDDPSVTPESGKSPNTSSIKANRAAARRKRLRLAEVENLLSARL